MLLGPSEQLELVRPSWLRSHVPVWGQAVQVEFWTQSNKHFGEQRTSLQFCPLVGPTHPGDFILRHHVCRRNGVGCGDARDI